MINMTAEERKQRPLFSGVMNYFPLALMELAHCSWIGNEQHNPGQPLHWSREKSDDHLDCCARHLLEAGTMDSDGVRHSAKLFWRAGANLQIEMEQVNSNSYAGYKALMKEIKCGSNITC